MKTLLNWLLVGTGDIARKRVAPALAGAESSRIAAMCDTDTAKASALAREYGVGKVFADYDEAIEDDEVNAVYIATPVALHVPMAIRAMNAKKHVLVEKPLGLSFADAEFAANVETTSGVTAGCAYYRRLYPAYAHVREMLDRGEFGWIINIGLRYFSWFDPVPDDPRHWRVIRSRSGGGPLADMGTHMFDVLIGLFDLPVRVSAMVSTLEREWNVEENAAVIMRMHDGAFTTGSFHWNSKTWSHTFEIAGTEGRVIWRPYDSGRIVVVKGKDATELDLAPAENVHRPLIDDFIAAVREGRPPAVTFAEAAKTNRLLDAVYLSAKKEREIEV